MEVDLIKTLSKYGEEFDDLISDLVQLQYLMKVKSCQFMIMFYI